MDCLGSSLIRRSDGIDAFAGMQQIGGTLTATSGPTVSFMAIPARFSHLLVEVLGVSHDGASNQQLRLELSPDGSVWTAPASLATGIGNSALLYGSFLVPGYTRGTGSISPTFGNLSADLAMGNIGGLACSWRIAAGIAAMRFSWSGSANFDASGAGLFKLHGF